MLNSNLFKTCFLISAMIFCLSVSSVSAQPCDGPDCPKSLSIIPKTVQYPDDWLLKWDPANPQEMDPNSSVAAKVIGGVGPFVWQVTGNDFWLDAQHTITQIKTSGRETDIYTGSNACGSVSIVVKDSRNSEDIGNIRSSVGRWGSWTLVAEVYDYEIGCPGGGATYIDYVYPCSSPAFEWEVTRWINGQNNFVCKRPYCKNGADCTGSGTSCGFEITDGICTYDWTLDNYCGASLVEMYRREYICE